MPVYSMDIREKIVSAYEAGNTSIRKVAKRFMVSKGVVTRLLHQKKTTGDLSPKPATGGKASQLAPHQAEIIEMVNQHPDWTLEEYCEHWQELSGTRLSASAMCRFLSKQNL
jgi:transposase